METITRMEINKELSVFISADVTGPVQFKCRETEVLSAYQH